MFSMYFLLLCLSLGESIAANNAYRKREGELVVRGSAVQEDGAAFGKSFPLSTTGPTSPSPQSIDSLIEKLQSGMQVSAWDGLCFWGYECMSQGNGICAILAIWCFLFVF